MRVFRCFLLLALPSLLLPDIANSVNVYRYSPDEHTTITQGEGITFSIGADDPYGLDFSEWYIGAEFQENHDMSGYYDEETWAHTFDDTGAYWIYAYAYNIYTEDDFTWWKITVEEPPSNPPSIWRISPSNSSITIVQGTNQSFSVGAALDFSPAPEEKR